MAKKYEHILTFKFTFDKAKRAVYMYRTMITDSPKLTEAQRYSMTPTIYGSAITDAALVNTTCKEYSV